jgi:hypothetical protein
MIGRFCFFFQMHKKLAILYYTTFICYSDFLQSSSRYSTGFQKIIVPFELITGIIEFLHLTV